MCCVSLPRIPHCAAVVPIAEIAFFTATCGCQRHLCIPNGSDHLVWTTDRYYLYILMENSYRNQDFIHSITVLSHLLYAYKRTYNIEFKLKTWMVMRNHRSFVGCSSIRCCIIRLHTVASTKMLKDISYDDHISYCKGTNSTHQLPSLYTLVEPCKGVYQYF